MNINEIFIKLFSIPLKEFKVVKIKYIFEQNNRKNKQYLTMDFYK